MQSGVWCIRSGNSVFLIVQQVGIGGIRPVRFVGERFKGVGRRAQGVHCGDYGAVIVGSGGNGSGGHALETIFECLY